MAKDEVKNYGCDWTKYDSLSLDFPQPEPGRGKFVISKAKGGIVQKECKSQGQQYIQLICAELVDGEKTDKSFTVFLSLSRKKNDKGNAPIQVTKAWLEAVGATDYMASGASGDLRLLEGVEFYADISYKTDDKGYKNAITRKLASAAVEEGTANDEDENEDDDSDSDSDDDSDDGPSDDDLGEDAEEEEEEKPKKKGAKKPNKF